MGDGDRFRPVLLHSNAGCPVYFTAALEHECDKQVFIKLPILNRPLHKSFIEAHKQLSGIQKKNFVLASMKLVGSSTSFSSSIGKPVK